MTLEERVDAFGYLVALPDIYGNIRRGWQHDALGEPGYTLFTSHVPLSPLLRGNKFRTQRGLVGCLLTRLLSRLASWKVQMICACFARLWRGTLAKYE